MAERRATLEEQHNTTSYSTCEKQARYMHRPSRADTFRVLAIGTSGGAGGKGSSSRFNIQALVCRHAWQSGVPLWTSTATTCVKASTRALVHQCMCRRGCADRGRAFDAGVGRTALKGINALTHVDNV